MELIDNINRLLGDDLKRALKPGARLKVAASCFSKYAFAALKDELEQVDELHFIFTSPTFMAEEVTDKIRKERKEFHIPKLRRQSTVCLLDPRNAVRARHREPGPRDGARPWDRVLGV